MRDRTPHTSPPAPSRRRVLRGTLSLGAVAASAAALGGCDSTFAQGFTGGAPSPSRLNFWNPFTGGDGERLLAMQSVYRARHRATDLKSATFVWGNPYYTKLTLATLGDRPPQVAVSHLSKVPTLAEAGLLTELQPSDLADHGLTEDKFDPRPWKKSHLGGKLYAVPLDTHPFVLYFRTDIAEKAGLLDGQGRLTDVDGPDKFIDALRAAKEVTGQWGGSVASVKDASTQFRLFWSFYRQIGGGDLVADQGKKVVIDVAAAAEALAYIRRLTQEKVVPTTTDSPGAITMLTTGKAGFLMDGVWQVLTVQGSKVKFDMRPLPRIFDDAPYACAADSHALVLPKAPSDRAQRLDLSLGFIASLLGSSKLWAEGGHIPAWLPTQQSSAYKALEPQSHYAAAADGAAYDPVAWYGGAGSSLQIIIGDAVTSVFTGATSPTAGAARMRRELREIASRPSPL
ncbi:multiple sugar transport system substrate-binding protein [Streptomyces aurantiacus]|uniref:extracellular solute-binding protein n=1 Tax=Streptomyces aurantiacus TaxID=47760 RepID=UPI00278DF43D|nr:extracellular solute-binding protein [Streptomyces aurantiacus]MDQ0772291.1 multiple sugar transport system substrate-binding protein [Streptomyces aurantiacus]